MKKNDESLITIGKVLKEWGIKGDMLVLPLTFDPERFSLLKKVAVETKNKGLKTADAAKSSVGAEWKNLTSVKKHKNMILLRFDGCNSPQEARKYRGAIIKIKKSDSPQLEEGTYYYYQIIGMDVYNVKGFYLGQVTSIIETGSNDVYVVKKQDYETLIPAIEDVIISIDTGLNKMIVKEMDVIEE